RGAVPAIRPDPVLHQRRPRGRGRGGPLGAAGARRVAGARRPGHGGRGDPRRGPRRLRPAGRAARGRAVRAVPRTVAPRAARRGGTDVAEHPVPPALEGGGGRGLGGGRRDGTRILRGQTHFAGGGRLAVVRGGRRRHDPV